MTRRKLVCIVLTLVMIITTSYSVFAAIPSFDAKKPYFEIESKTVDKGTAFEVDVNIGNNPGFWAAKFSITCNKNLNFVTSNGEAVYNTAKIENASFETNYSNNVFTCLITSENSSNVTYNGTVLTLKFTTSVDVFQGDYSISFTDYSSTNFIDYDGNKVAFTFANGTITVGEGKVFEAYKCSPTWSSTATHSNYSQTDLTPNGTLSNFNPTVVGDYINYTLADVEPGTYELITFSRDTTSNRGTFDIYADDVFIDTVDYMGEFAVNRRVVGTFTVDSTKNVVIKFSTNVVGKLYLMYIEINKVKTSTTSTTSGTTNTTTEVPEQTTVTTIETTTGPATLDTSSAIKVSDVSTTSNWIVGQYNISTGGYEASTTRVCVSKLVKVTPGSIYIFTTGYSDYELKFVVRAYDSKGTFYSSVGAISNNGAYSVPSAVSYITVALYHNTGKLSDILTLINYNVIKPTVVEQTKTTNPTTDSTTDPTTYNTTTTTKNNDNPTTTLGTSTTSEKATSESSAIMHTVSIDGALVSVKKGDIFVLPNLDDDVAAYQDKDGNYYSCSQEIVVDDDLEFTSVKLSIQTLSTAAMRLKSSEVTNNISGIRFYTEVDQDLVSILRENDITVEFGTLIAPKSYFGNKKPTDLKFGVDFGKTSNYVDVKYESTKYFTDSRFSGFVGSIINIKDDHACWNFVGRGYARITINGIEKIVYANGKDSLPERSIAFIAHKLRYDEDVYENFNNAQKAIIDFYNEIYKKETDDPYEEDMFI